MSMKALVSRSRHALMLRSVHCGVRSMPTLRDAPLWTRSCPWFGANEVRVLKSYSSLSGSDSSTGPNPRSTCTSGAVGCPRVNALFWLV